MLLVPIPRTPILRVIGAFLILDLSHFPGSRSYLDAPSARGTPARLPHARHMRGFCHRLAIFGYSAYFPEKRLFHLKVLR